MSCSGFWSKGTEDVGGSDTGEAQDLLSAGIEMINFSAGGIFARAISPNARLPLDPRQCSVK
jgi:hypothetical protein